MATKTLQYKIGMDIGELRRNAEAAGTYTRAFKRELDELEKKQQAHRKTLGDLGRGMATFGAATVVGLGLAAKAAIEWESAWTGVRKTVDGSDAEMAQLEGQLRQLARTLPASHKEIAAVAEAAGQLGIKRKDIAGFTKTMIDLGETTNLTAEEAATDLAKFSNIMGTSASEVDKLGSALVALGNDGASTEKDIIKMGLRIAGAGKQIGLTEAQVLGFASALSSVGIEAEAGGSSISTTMIKISKAVADGGEQLEAFANIAGMSGEKFAQQFRTDAAGAITAFLQGLNRMQTSGENVFGVLDELGLSEIRVRDALLRAGSASDLFTKSLQVGSSAWAENTALTEEANKRYATSASKIKVAWNQIQDALIDVGSAVVPVVSSLTTGVGDIVRAFQGLPGPAKDVVTWAGLALGGVAGIGGAALIAGPKIMDFRDKMSKMSATGGTASKVLAGFGTLMVGPLGAALAGGAVLLGIWAAKTGAAQRKQAELAASAKQIADVIKDQNYQINQAVIKATAQKAASEGLLTTAGKLGVAEGRVTEAILGQGSAYEDLIRVLVQKHQAAVDANGATSDEARAVFELIQKLAILHGETKTQVDLNKAADTETKNATESQKRYGNQVGLTKAQLEEASDALEGMNKALDSTNSNTLSARGAEREFAQSVNDAYVALQEQMNALDANETAMGNRARTLDNSTEAGRENAAMLDEVARNANDLAKAVSAQAEAQGGAAAGAQAMIASLEASRPVLLSVAEAFGMSREEAERYADQVLHLPEVPSELVPTPGQLGVHSQFDELARVRNMLGAVTTAQGQFNIQLGKTGTQAKTAKEKLDDLVTAMDTINETSLSTREARRRRLQAIGDAATQLKDEMEALDANGVAMGERARTLDENTELGRKNNQILDDQARAALELAKAVAREAEANGGAAAGAAALTASLKASRPQLIETAKLFGMNQAQAEAYANDVLAIPTAHQIAIATPGAKQSQVELQGVKNKADALPPQKWINVGVLSKTAFQELEALGFKVQRLPNGNVMVLADTNNAQRTLDNYINSNAGRRFPVYVDLIGGGQRRVKDIEIYGFARGGIVSYASGGMEDHRPQIARAQTGRVRMWAERETGRESYIPWAKDRRQRATRVLQTTASGFGYDLAPKGVPAAMVAGGGGSMWMGGGGGHFTLEVVGGDSDVQRFLAGMISKYVRVAGSGSVQNSFGQRY